MGLAIGKKGENIRRLQNVLGKRVEMVEHAETLEEFIRNIFRPAEVSGMVRLDDQSVNVIVARRSELGIAIGKGGSTIEKARVLTRRFFHTDVNEIICSPEKSDEPV